MADEEDEKEEVSGEEGAEGEEGEEKKSGKFKLILFIVLPIILIGGGGAGAYFTGMLDSVLGIEKTEDGEHAHEGEDDHDDHGKKHAKDDGHGSDKKHAKKKGKKHAKDDAHGGDKKHGKDDGHGDGHGDSDGGAFVAIPPMLVNLNTEDSTPRFLRLTVQLELEDPDEHDAVVAVLPRVVDQFQTYLRELRVRDLRGSAGIYRLQVELLWRVNQAVEPIEIKDVLFQEILIQ